MDEQEKKELEETETKVEEELETEGEGGSEAEVEEGKAPVVETEPAEKMLTQSQVNELVGRARQEGRESAMRDLYGRYGVSGDAELDEVFGNGQRYYNLDDEYKAQGDSMRALQAENALLKTKVDEARWGDIRLILGGKGLEITPENIEAELPSHPEWKKAEAEVVTQSEPTMLRKLGSEAKAETEDGDDEQEMAMKLFGLR